MIVAAITELIVSLLKSTVIFFIGRILCQPLALRRFLGLNSLDEDLSDFHSILVWIENIGWIVKLIAVFTGITAIVTTIIIAFFNLS